MPQEIQLLVKIQRHCRRHSKYRTYCEEALDRLIEKRLNNTADDFQIHHEKGLQELENTDFSLVARPSIRRVGTTTQIRRGSRIRNSNYPEPQLLTGDIDEGHIEDIAPLPITSEQSERVRVPFSYVPEHTERAQIHRSLNRHGGPARELQRNGGSTSTPRFRAIERGGVDTRQTGYFGETHREVFQRTTA